MKRDLSLLPTRVAHAIFGLALAAAPALPLAAAAQEEPAAEESPASAVVPAEGTPAEVPAEGAPAEAAAPAPTEPVATIPVEAAPEPEDKAAGQQFDTIEVTGSRLKRTDYETAQPVVTISREDIERSGQTDINELLRHLSVAGNNSLTPAANRASLSMGEVNLDLRNLGSQHTLLLVNGRRWVTGLIPTQPNVADYNTIPTAVIERIEILKDGASAIYGSDAIGGVVNVITRKDYEGFGLDYQYGGFVEQGDGENQQISLDWGRVMQGTSAFINLSYTSIGRAEAANRDFTASPVPSAGKTRWSTNTERGRLTFIPTQANGSYYNCPSLQGPVAASVVADPILSPILTDTEAAPAGLQLCTLHLIPGAPGGAMDDYRQTIDYEDYYNRFKRDTLQQPNERTALYGQLSHQLTDSITLSFEGLYNMRRSKGISYNLAFAGGDAIDGTGRTGILAGHPENPFGQNIGYDATGVGLAVGYGVWTMRLVDDRANMTWQQAVDTLRLGSALTGEIELLGQPLSWNGGYIYARNEIEEILPQYRYDRMQQQVGNVTVTDPNTGDVTYSYDGTVCQAPCVPVHVFNGQAGFDYGAVSYATYDTWQRNRGGQDIAFFDVSTLFPQAEVILAGPLAVATGFEYRKDKYYSFIDPVIKAGDLVGINQQDDSGGQNEAKEAYLEMGIPLIKDLPLLHVVDLDLAGRYSEYPGFGSITTGKAGLRWQPIDDLLVRGTYSTGFRAPSIAELYLPAAQSGDPMADPCADPQKNQTTANNCVSDGAGSANGQITSPYALWKGDPNLRPEESINITYGLVYSPSFVPDLNLAVDFFDITIDKYITIGGGLAQYFLDSCYKSERPTGAPANSGPYCQFVHRDSGELDFVDVPFFNLGKIETSGVDFDAAYVLPLPDSIGRIKWTLNTTYTSTYNQYTPQPNQPDVVSGLVGKSSGQFTGFPRWKAGTELVWKQDVWSASWSTRMAYHMNEPCNDFLYEPSYRELGLCSNPRLDADGNDISENKLKTVYYHNVQLGRELPAYNADLTFGVNNVLDQDPPQSYSLIGSYFWFNYDPTHYETPGRFAYMRVGFKF